MSDLPHPTSQDWDLIAPDCLMPSQFRDMHRSLADRECQTLWLAALTQAIYDYTRYRNATKSKYIRLYEEARSWLNGGSSDVGAFHWVCDALEIDPVALRASLGVEGLRLPRSGPRIRAGSISTPRRSRFRARRAAEVEA